MMNTNEERKIVTTADGSSTVFHALLNQHYHSIHGAVQESQHVFMKMGWEEAVKTAKEILLLEIGFGTGLNAFLVLQECMRDASVHVSYQSLEAFPLSKEEAAELNYAEEKDKEIFQELHAASWNAEENITVNFTLHKKKITLEEFIPVAGTYDLIFFDAFSPEAQPELWTEEIFKKLYSGMKPNGILVTYCAKGQVRRNLIGAGFTVERLQGPPGKREMLRGRKCAD